jgi:Flp pilus assembly protein TadG
VIPVRCGVRRHDDGAVAVEFALVFPVLLLVIFGLVDFGRLYWAQLALTSAAREGVRASALGLEDVTARVQTAASPLTGVDVVIDTCPSPLTGDATTSVTAAHDFDFVTPVSAFMAFFGGPGVDGRILTSTAVMRCPG